MNKVNLINDVAFPIAGGVAAEVGMDLLDTKVPMFSKTPYASSLAVTAAGLAGLYFLPQKFSGIFTGMLVVGGVDAARKTGIINGFEEVLNGLIVGDTFPRVLSPGDTVVA